MTRPADASDITWTIMQRLNPILEMYDYNVPLEEWMAHHAEHGDQVIAKIDQDRPEHPSGIDLAMEADFDAALTREEIKEVTMYVRLEDQQEYSIVIRKLEGSPQKP